MAQTSKTIIAALIVIAIAIAAFIYSNVMQPSAKNAPIELNPGADIQTPKGAPSVTPPTMPPPAN